MKQRTLFTSPPIGGCSPRKGEPLREATPSETASQCVGRALPIPGQEEERGCSLSYLHGHAFPRGDWINPSIPLAPKSYPVGKERRGGGLRFPVLPRASRSYDGRGTPPPGSSSTTLSYDRQGGLVHTGQQSWAPLPMLLPAAQFSVRSSPPISPGTVVTR